MKRITTVMMMLFMAILSYGQRKPTRHRLMERTMCLMRDGLPLRERTTLTRSTQAPTQG